MEYPLPTDRYQHPDPGVMYIVMNLPGPGAYREGYPSQYIKGCSCTDRCTNCSCVRGSPNYIDDRIVEDKLSVPIIECDERCTCSRSCGNRVVQRGPLDCLEIKEFGGKGLGLTTTKPITKGQFICQYLGEVISVEEARRRVERNRLENSMNYVIVVSEHIGERTITTCVDAKYFANIGRYCNHSCDPTAIMVPVRIEGPVPGLSLFARRNIEPGEEVTFSYAGAADYSVHNHSSTPCLCGSANCSGYLPHHPI